MPWPAWYRELEDATSGTVYIEPEEFPRAFAKHPKRGQAWKFHGTRDKAEWTTYCPTRELSYKNVHRLGAENQEDFWKIVNDAKAGGIGPPTSLADMFLSVCRIRPPRLSALAPFYGYRFGGWQACRRGSFTGPLYQYDLNRAYRWAATASGLPKLATARITKDWTHPRAVYLVDARSGIIPWEPWPGVKMVTSEMREALRLTDRPGVRFLYGVEFRGETSLVETFADVDKRFPHCSKRIGQGFWGLWNTTDAPIQVGFKSGTERQMRNPFYNPVWACWITSRVKLRLLHWQRISVRTHTDSIIVRERIPTGDQPGDWKLVETFDSLWVRHPGCYGTGPYTLKHSGRGSVLLSRDHPLVRFARAVHAAAGSRGVTRGEEPVPF